MANFKQEIGELVRDGVVVYYAHVGTDRTYVESITRDEIEGYVRADKANEPINLALLGVRQLVSRYGIVLVLGALQSIATENWQTLKSAPDYSRSAAFWLRVAAQLGTLVNSVEEAISRV